MHSQVAMKNQGNHIDTEAERFCREKRLAAEFGIIGNGNLICGKTAGKKRSADMAELHLAPNFLAEGGFNLRTELIRIDEEGRDDKNQKNDQDDDAYNDERFLSAGHGGTS